LTGKIKGTVHPAGVGWPFSKEHGWSVGSS